MDINGKVAVVTGGASGLGEGTVRHLHSLGAKIAIFDMNEDRANTIIDELGENVAFFNVNVTEEEAVANAINGTMEKFGAIHICCNYAGVAWPEKTLGKGGPHVLGNFTNIININLIGTFNVLRLAAEQMAKNEPVTEDGERGVIINTASVAAYEGQIGQAAYAASKGGVVGMTLPVARDLAYYGIRCNTIAPGLIHTPLFDALPEAAYESLCKQPVFPQRLGKTSEIARTAQYIIENGYVNGETIRMDGAIRMQPK